MGDIEVLGSNIIEKAWLKTTIKTTTKGSTLVQSGWPVRETASTEDRFEDCSVSTQMLDEGSLLEANVVWLPQQCEGVSVLCNFLVDSRVKRNTCVFPPRLRYKRLGVTGSFRSRPRSNALSPEIFLLFNDFSHLARPALHEFMLRTSRKVHACKTDASQSKEAD